MLAHSCPDEDLRSETSTSDQYFHYWLRSAGRQPLMYLIMYLCWRYVLTCFMLISGRFSNRCMPSLRWDKILNVKVLVSFRFVPPVYISLSNLHVPRGGWSCLLSRSAMLGLIFKLGNGPSSKTETLWNFHFLVCSLLCKISKNSMAREGLEEKCKFLGETNLFFLVLLLERTHGTLNIILYNVLSFASFKPLFFTIR